MGIHDREYYQDEPAPMRMAVRQQSVVIKLVIINAVVFAVNFILAGGDGNGWLMLEMANRPSDLLNPLHWWTLITCGFAHSPSGINHILFNMLGLYFLGPDVEARMGSREFLAFYLIAIVFSALLSDLRYLFFVDQSNWPVMLGASGAVVAVTILYALYFPKRKLLLMFVLPMPAWGVAILIVLMSVTGTGEGIAHDVHLFGAVFAAAYFFSGLKFTSFSGRIMQRKPKLRVVRHDVDEDLIRQGDKLLEKVHREGEESLTRKERKLLERYSRYLRKQRDP